MNDKRHFKMYKHGKVWVTAVAGLGALLMGSVSMDASEQVSNNKEVVITQVMNNEGPEKSVTEKSSESAEVSIEGTEKVIEAPKTESESTEKVTEAPKTESESTEKVTEAPKTESESTVTEDKTNAPKTSEKTTDVKSAENKTEKSGTADGWQGNTYFKDGEALTGEQTIDGKKYLFGTDGVAKTGLQIVGKNKRYYDLKTFELKRDTYVTVGEDTYYFNNNGNALAGSRKVKRSNGQVNVEAFDRTTFRQIKNGYYTTIDNKSTYYLNENGNALAGSRKVKRSNGQVNVEAFDRTTFRQIKNGYYTTIDNKSTYYLNGNGNALAGSRKVKRSNGDVNVEAFDRTTFRQIKNGYYTTIDKKSIYYLNGNGNALAGSRKFKSNGRDALEAYSQSTFKQIRNGYYTTVDKKGTYYLGGNGNAVSGIRDFKDSKGNWQVEGYNNSNFRQVRNDYFKSNGSWFYLNGSGRGVKGLRFFGNNVEFYGNDYKLYMNKWKTVNNTQYYFGKSGKATEVLLNYKYYSQLNQGAPQGCEGASMQIALSHKGRYVPSLQEIYRKTGSGYGVSPSKGFYGNPFGNGGAVTETIFASAMAKSFKSMGAVDITGAKKADIIRELNRGNAVVTWADYAWQLHGAHSFHVMTIVGYSGNSFLIADPYATSHRTMWISQDTWEYVNTNTQTKGYGSPKSMNMVIR